MSDSTRHFDTSTEFAAFGSGAVAYVRRVEPGDFNRRFPTVEELPVDRDLWGLFGADGNPLSVSDDQYVLLQDAQDRDLVAVHRQ